MLQTEERGRSWRTQNLIIVGLAKVEQIVLRELEDAAVVRHRLSDCLVGAARVAIIHRPNGAVEILLQRN